MTRQSLHVPKETQLLFQQAEDLVRDYFGQFERDASQGTLTIGGERYILVRASSMSVEFFEHIKGMYPGLNDLEAAKAASSILFDMAHALGKADAKEFNKRMGVTDPMANLSCGPMHFAHTGWASVELLPESRPSADEDFCIVYEHPRSFEADSWIKKNRLPEEDHLTVTTDIPVCFMNAGYSSGWCEYSFKLPLTAEEILCRARGDACCRFIMGHPKRIQDHLREYREKNPELFEDYKK